MRAVVVVGGFPAADGEDHADLAPVANGVVPFPGWEPFGGPDPADLGGDVPELAAAASVRHVDIDSGHWPPPTRPVEPAGLVADAARG